jgi:hypothetical protein
MRWSFVTVTGPTAILMQTFPPKFVLLLLLRLHELWDCLQNTDKELDREYSNEPDPNVMMVDNRKLIGVNIPQDDLVTCSRYSVMKKCSNIFFRGKKILQNLSLKTFLHVCGLMRFGSIWRITIEQSKYVKAMPQKIIGLSTHPAKGKIATGRYLFQWQNNRSICRYAISLRGHYVLEGYVGELLIGLTYPATQCLSSVQSTP